jgi:site-specific DNA-methyltransferase (adenine-specific)
MNQKPLRLMRRIINASTDSGDVVWEPFGGLCTASVAAKELDREACAAEQVPEFFDLAVERLENTKRGCMIEEPNHSRGEQAGIDSFSG